MASQEEDNKLQCISNINKEQERYYLNVYKKYDSILNDKSETFENKVQSLIDVWKSIAALNLSQFDIRYVIQIIDWAKLHALNIVLTGEWGVTKETFRNGLLNSIEKAQNNLSTVNDAFSSRCKKLADVVKNPWEDPVLRDLLQIKDVEIGSKEIEFFCIETAYLVSVRLKKLCESHCEDLALNLVTNFLNYKKLATVKNFNLNATETQIWFIFDIYIALLYKFQDKAKILQQFEELQLEEGIQLIKRFAKKRVKISKIWRNCHKIAIFGSRFFLSKALIKYNDDLKELLTDLLKAYLLLSNSDTLLQEFAMSVRNITNLADAAGLCVMCEVIHREAADKLRHFAIEMYIRALTTDMNELERLKHVNEQDKASLTTSRLADTFTNLADLLNDHMKVARECVLTAFSLEPTKARLKRIEDLARRSGFQVLDTGQEWKCRLHPPVLPSDDITWICPECGDWMCKPELTAPLQMNMALHEALQESVLGISEALCDDLVVCLSNPRYQILSWLLSWGDLYRLCIMYLNDPEKTKNFVTELKFVDVDYSLFEHIKREPVDEFTGIEKGYEQYLDLDFVSDEETSSVSEDSMSQDRALGLGSDGAGEPLLHLPQPKSDPNTLKSLRMFRPNLKRKKEAEHDTTAENLQPTLKSNKTQTSSSSLGTYLSAPLLFNNTMTNSKSSIPSVMPKTCMYSPVYRPGAAEVTTHSPTQETAARSSFSSYGYLTSYAAKPSSQASFDQSDCSRNSNNLRCYPSKSSEAKNPLLSSLVKSVSSTLNISTVFPSVTVKNNLGYNIPKSNSNPVNNSQNSFKNNTSNPDLTPCSLNQNTTKLNSLSSKSNAFLSKGTAVSDNSVQDLDALLREVVTEMDSSSYDSESKNGVAATLLQLGGQVANKHNQLIQVHQLVHQDHARQILPQKPPLRNGITKECRVLLKRLPSLEKLILDQIGKTLEPVKQKEKPISKVRATLQNSQTVSTPLKQPIKPAILENPQCTLKVEPSTHLQEKLLLPIKERLQEESVPHAQIFVPTLAKLPCQKEQFYMAPVLSVETTAPLEIPIPAKQTQTVVICPVAPVVELLPQMKVTSLPEIPLLQKSVTQPMPCQKEQSYMELTLPLEATTLSEIPLLQEAEQVPQTEAVMPEPAALALKKLAPCQEKTIPVNFTQLLETPPVQEFQPQLETALQLQTTLPELETLPCQKNAFYTAAPLEIAPPQESVPQTLFKQQLKPTQDFETSLVPMQTGVSKSETSYMEPVETAILEKPLPQKFKPQVTLEPEPQVQTVVPELAIMPCPQKIFQIEPVLRVETSNLLQIALSEKFKPQTIFKPQIEPPQKFEDPLETAQTRVPESATLSYMEPVPLVAKVTLLEKPQESRQQLVSKPQLGPPLEPTVQVETMVAEPEASLCQKEASYTESVQPVGFMACQEIPPLLESKPQMIAKHHLGPEETWCYPTLSQNPETQHLPKEPQRMEVQSRTVIFERSLKETIVTSLPDKNKVIIRKDLEPLTASTSLVKTLAKKKAGERIKVMEQQVVLQTLKEGSSQACTPVDSQKTIIPTTPDCDKDSQQTVQSDMQKTEINLTESNMEDGTPLNTAKDKKDKDLKRDNSILEAELTGVLEEKTGKNTHSTECISLFTNEKICEPFDTDKISGKNEVFGNQNVNDSITADVKENISNGIITDTSETCDITKNENVSEKGDCESDLIIKNEFNDNEESPFDTFSYIPLWHDYSKSAEQEEEDIEMSTDESKYVLFSDTFGDDNDKENIDFSDFSDKTSESSCESSSTETEELLVKEAFASRYKESSEENSLPSHKLDMEKLETSKLHQNTSPFETSMACIFEKKGILDDLVPKNSNLTKEIKKYSNSRKTRHINVPCFKVDQERRLNKKKSELSNLDVFCKLCKMSSNVKKCHKFRGRELKVLLSRLPSNEAKPRCKAHTLKDYQNISKKLERKIWKKFDIRVKNKKMRKKDRKYSPLLDFNIRHHIKTKSVKKSTTNKCVARKKEGMVERLKMNKSPLPLDKKDIARAVLRNVPGLTDYNLVRPNNTEQVVNVVQVSGSRPSNVVTQNTQTSTQVTPHIQRIGQPRLADAKPETSCESNSTQASPALTTTSLGTVKTTTSQPSTLINILSQQIRPSQSSVRTRQTPFINIVSQQIIRPGSVAKCSTTNSLHTTAAAAVSDNQNATIIKVEPASEVPADAESSTNNTKTVNTNVKIVTTTTQAGAAGTNTSSQGGTILQFICKSSLPKFQQAFGKAVYQNPTGTEASDTSSTSVVEMTSSIPTATIVEAKKIVPTKAVPVNVQPLQGNVIYRGQVPVGQTISLIPPGSTTRQLFRITGSSHEQISLVKETVIQNKMSALLAAALQGKPKVSEQNGDVVEEYSATRITLCRPTGAQNATRIVKPVQLQIPANVIRSPQPNLSSTTLEQLREFDMVYKQVKERSTNSSTPLDTPNNAQSVQEPPQQQRISFTYVNQVQKYTQLSPVVVVSSYSNLQPSPSTLSVTSQSSSSPCLTPASTVTVPKMTVKASKGKNIKTSPLNTATKPIPAIPKPQQKPQEDEHTTQRIFDILAEYAEQLRNSPDLNNKPAPRRRSNPPTNPSSSSKRKKSSKKTSSSSSIVETDDNEDLTLGSEDSSGGNIVQLSVTDDEHSQAASITPPESNSEATTNTRPLIMADASNPHRNVIIADSSVGEALKMPNTALIMPGSYIMPVSVVKGGQQIAVVSGGSKILTTVPARSGQNMLLFQSFLNQNKKGAISAVKYSTIQPISGISSQNIAGVSAQPPVVLPSSSVAAAVALGQPITLKKLDDGERGNTELLLTIAQPRETLKIEKIPEIAQPDSSTSLSSDSIEVKIEETSQSDSSSNENMFKNFQKTGSVATSVIASCVKKAQHQDDEASELHTSNIKDDDRRPGERMQSVLVNASTSNGPMLSHTNTRYRKPLESVQSTTSPNKEFSHNGGKTTASEQKIFKNNAVYYTIRTKKGVVNPVSKKLESELQKQAVIERELRLQKSLSEECEDLGVDEPSTSDLFPEADLLFDSNHSPSYDQSAKAQVTDGKAKTSMNLFSDDENSGPLRNDLFDYVEYRSSEGLEQINGNNTSNESASSCEDTTLLPNCGTMSEVTLNSPISPEIYSDNSQVLNKYKYKYTNRKKGEKNKQSDNWSEVTSTEDTIEPLRKSEELEEESSFTGTGEELTGEGFKVVRVISNLDDKYQKEEKKCQLHCMNEDESKRGPRKSSKKPCSCCNGSKGAGASNIRKRPTSRPQTPAATSKKLLVSKKR